MNVHDRKGNNYTTKRDKIGYRKDATRHGDFFTVNIFSDTQSDRLFAILSYEVKAIIHIKPL